MTQIKKKRKRRRLNKLGKMVVYGGSATIALITSICFLPGHFETKELKELGYSKEAIAEIKEQKLSKIIRKNDYYTENLEKHILKGEINTDYIEYYLNLETFNKDSETIITKLKAKGYSDEELIKLLSVYTPRNLYPLLVYSKISDVDMYVTSGMDSDESLLEPYEDVNEVTEWSTNMLISKKNLLSEDVTILNLREVDNHCAFKETIMVDEAASAFETMCNKAKEEGVHFASSYGYRSYEDQNDIYTSYVNKNGIKEADEIAARPGASEHQAGLAVDIASMKKTAGQAFADTAEYTWLVQNAHRYGFIERYTEANELITGYDAEPWHWRYVGVELATAVKNSGLSYDEYYELYLRKTTVTTE